jgi:integrase
MFLEPGRHKLIGMLNVKNLFAISAPLGNGAAVRRVGIPKLAPHDLRRTCARLCHASGGELEQIQFLLGHVSVQTTGR